jgi:hypothetical protein
VKAHGKVKRKKLKGERSEQVGTSSLSPSTSSVYLSPVGES